LLVRRVRRRTTMSTPLCGVGVMQGARAAVFVVRSASRAAVPAVRSASPRRPALGQLLRPRSSVSCTPAEHPGRRGCVRGSRRRICDGLGQRLGSHQQALVQRRTDVHQHLIGIGAGREVAARDRAFDDRSGLDHAGGPEPSRDRARRFRARAPGDEGAYHRLAPRRGDRARCHRCRELRSAAPLRRRGRRRRVRPSSPIVDTASSCVCRRGAPPIRRSGPRIHVQRARRSSHRAPPRKCEPSCRRASNPVMSSRHTNATSSCIHVRHRCTVLNATASCD